MDVGADVLVVVAADQEVGAREVLGVQADPEGVRGRALGGDDPEQAGLPISSGPNGELAVGRELGRAGGLFFLARDLLVALFLALLLVSSSSSPSSSSPLRLRRRPPRLRRPPSSYSSSSSS
jgi:hypothetical protein